MFGLTKREQRWKAEQQAAELLVGFAATAVRAATDVRIAEAHAELEKLRKENAELRASLAGVGATSPLLEKDSLGMHVVQLAAEADEIAALRRELARLTGADGVPACPGQTFPQEDADAAAKKGTP
jgi:hypothetical protein